VSLQAQDIESEGDPAQDSSGSLTQRIGFIGAGDHIATHSSSISILRQILSWCTLPHKKSLRDALCDVGNMGEAMMRGFSKGVSSADRMSASVRTQERKQTMTSLGFRVFPDALKGGAEQLAAGNDIIFLGVHFALPLSHFASCENVIFLRNCRTNL
jgi:hypothetical protein